MRLLWAFDFAPIDGSDALTPTWDIETEFIDVSFPKNIINWRNVLTIDNPQGITLTPKPFQCKITPRNEEKVEIIEQSYKAIVDSA